MDIEACRIEFMEWLRTRPEVLNIGYDPESGKFVLREDQERWEAWQASRRSLKLNIPVWSNSKYHRFTYSDPLIKQLDMYGIQIK